MHRKLEENSILSKLTQKSSSLPEYLSVLQKIIGFIYPLEAELLFLSKFNGALPGLGRGLKCQLVRDDVSKPSDQSSTSVQNRTELPDVNILNTTFSYLMKGKSVKITLNIRREKN